MGFQRNIKPEPAIKIKISVPLLKTQCTHHSSVQDNRHTLMKADQDSRLVAGCVKAIQA